MTNSIANHPMIFFQYLKATKVRKAFHLIHLLYLSFNPIPYGGRVTSILAPEGAGPPKMSTIGIAYDPTIIFFSKSITGKVLVKISDHFDTLLCAERGAFLVFVGQGVQCLDGELVSELVLASPPLIICINFS